MKLTRFDFEVTRHRVSQVKGKVSVFAETYEDALVLAKYGDVSWNYADGEELPLSHTYKRLPGPVTLVGTPATGS